MLNKFLKTLSVFKEYGWSKALMGNTKCGFCSLAGLAIALRGLVYQSTYKTRAVQVGFCTTDAISMEYEWPDDYTPPHRANTTPAGPEQLLLAQVVKEKYPEYIEEAMSMSMSIVIVFNDDPKTTQEMVEAVFQEAANRYR